LENHKSDSSNNDTAAGLIGASVLIYVGIAASTSVYWYYQERTQTILRGFFISAIFQKTTETRVRSSKDEDNKAAITLMSADVERIYTGMRNVHEIWASVIQTGLACWLLYRQLGLAFVAPLVIVILSFSASLFMSKYAVRYQGAWMRLVQKRIGVTSHVLAHVKDLKISGMTGPATDLVQDTRVEEIAKGTNVRTLTGISAALSQVPLAVAPVVAFAFGPMALDVTKVFISLSYLALLTAPLQLLLQVVPIVLACLACLRRIGAFLMGEPRRDFRVITSLHHQLDSNEKPPLANAITVRGANFGWSPDKVVLEDVNFSIPCSSLTFVTGPVASGKSTLCKALLGETPIASGEVILSTERIAYCDQIPFLMNGTLQESIVGYSSFDPARYAEVIDVAMLHGDLDAMPLGDQTQVGNKGTALSGGQRQRIALARALYHHADLLILDDVFASLDAATQDEVCRRVFGPQGLLRRRGATALLCTQAIRFHHVADQVITLTSAGRIASISSLKTSVSPEPCINSYPIDITQDKTIQQLKGNDRPALVADSWPAPVTRSRPFDKDADNQLSIPPVADRSVYKHYLETISGLILAVYIAMVLGIGFFSNFSTVWLRFWGEDDTDALTSGQPPNHAFAFYIGIYAALAAGSLMCVLFGGLIVLTRVVSMSGTRLHESTIKTIMNARLSFLSKSNLGGRVLSLFSQDMSIIDTQLPRMVNNLCICLSLAAGQAIVIGLSNAYLAISYPFFLAVLYAIQRVYLPTSKQLRLLDLEMTAPLYAHFVDTLAGLATLRAMGYLPGRSVERNNELLDRAQRPSYLLAMAQQWLLLTMNVVVAVLAVILVTLATQLRSSSSGAVGAGLVSLITLGSVMTNVLSAYTGLEIALGGISRLKSFSESTEKEETAGDGIELGEQWPSRGEVQFRNVSASYDGRSTILDNVSFNLQPGEKVALLGHTGR